MIGLQTAHPPVGPSSAMSYFSGKSGPNQEDYNQVRHLQGHPVMLSSNSHQYRETGNGYRSPDSISPYRSPAMADDYSPSPSRQFMEAHVSPPPGGSSQHHSSHQVAPGRTNSIVARMEGIEVSSNRRDVDDPPEGSAPHDRSGIVDGRGNGDVVMQRSNEANARRTFSDGRIGILPPGTFSRGSTKNGVELIRRLILDAPRTYTSVKLVGDGSFGTVWLCDWASPLAPETKLSAMQCG
jgi:hypothetical protein